MPYNIPYTDTANNGYITVIDGTLNETTSLRFPGRNFNGYGPAISQNFLQLLENFASPFEPSNPVQGQIWYDTSPEKEQQLRVFDGTSWLPTGGLNRAVKEPDVANSQTGDLWVDTENQQLYLNSGSGWILVGPDFSDGLKTGASPLKIVDTNNQDHSVVIIEVAAKPVCIIATEEFSPKTTIPGFSVIKPGYNLSNDDDLKFRGVSEKAESLIVNGSAVQAGNFLRSDAPSATQFPLNIQNNTGAIFGTDSALNIGVEGQAGIIQHRIEGSNIDVRVRNNGSTRTVLRIDSSEKVGINNKSPEEALDVSGNVQVSDRLRVKGTTPSTSTSTGSITTAGGVGIQENLNVEGSTYLKNLVTVAGNITPSENNQKNIGTAEKKFQKIYADTFVGNVIGTVSGTVSGSSSSTNRLNTATTFKMTGDVSANDIAFDGQTGGLVKEFATSLSNSVIASREIVERSNADDEILLNRISGQSGLYKISVSELTSRVPTNPPGVIVSYAGDEAPPGWLLCDGSEYKIGDYSELFSVVQYKYAPRSQVSTGKFKVPDLRGRIPLGPDNMGGSSANNVTANYAQGLGRTGGKETTDIGVENLPEHKHDMRGDSGNQYYALRDISGNPDDPEAVTYDAPDDLGNGQAMANSGGILFNNDLHQPLDVMNPTLTLNYIIFTGRSS